MGELSRETFPIKPLNQSHPSGFFVIYLCIYLFFQAVRVFCGCVGFTFFSWRKPPGWWLVNESLVLLSCRGGDTVSVRFAVTESCAFKPAALRNRGGFGAFSSLAMSSCLRCGSLLGREVSWCDVESV